MLVGEDGYLTEEDWYDPDQAPPPLLIGRHYSDSDVGRWVDGRGRIIYFDLDTRFILAWRGPEPTPVDLSRTIDAIFGRLGGTARQGAALRARGRGGAGRGAGAGRWTTRPAGPSTAGPSSIGPAIAGPAVEDAAAEAAPPPAAAGALMFGALGDAEPAADVAPPTRGGAGSAPAGSAAAGVLTEFGPASSSAAGLQVWRVELPELAGLDGVGEQAGVLVQRARERVDQVGGGVPGVDAGMVGRADIAPLLGDTDLQVWHAGPEVEFTAGEIDRSGPSVTLAEAEGRGRLVADGSFNTAPEASAAKTPLYDIDVGGASRAEVHAWVDAIDDALAGPYVTATVRELFPWLTPVNDEYGDLTIKRSEYNETKAAQITAEVAPQMRYAMYQWIKRYPYPTELGPIGSQLQPAFEFAGWLVRLFNGDEPAEPIGFGRITTAFGYGINLYTKFAALAYAHLNNPGLLKGRLEWALRLPLDKDFAELPAELRLVLTAHASAIEQQLADHFTFHERAVVDRIAAERGGPVDLLHTELLRPKPANEDDDPASEDDDSGWPGTLSKYIRGGLVPGSGTFDPSKVFSIHTVLSDVVRHPKGVVLVAGEFRFLGDGSASRRWKIVEARVRSGMREIFRSFMWTRTPAGAWFSTPIDLARASADLRRQAAAVDPDAGVALRLTRLMRLGAAELFDHLARDGYRLDLAVLEPVLAGLSYEMGVFVVRGAVEIVHEELDAKTRAGVAEVDTSGAALPEPVVRAIADWHNAPVRTGPETYVQPSFDLSDWYEGAHSAPEVVNIADVDRRWRELAAPYGGPLGLLERLGMTYMQTLRNSAYLAAATYGMSFDETHLLAMRRLIDTLQPELERPVALYSDLEVIVRIVRGDDPNQPMRPVDLGQVRVLADLVAEMNRDTTLPELRQRVAESPDLAAALHWVAPIDEFTVSPDRVGVAQILARLQTLAGPDGLPGLIAEVLETPHGLRDGWQALWDAAHLAAHMYTEEFSKSDLRAVARVLDVSRPGTGWRGIEDLVRYLLNDPKRSIQASAQYSARPYQRLLVEMVRDRPMTVEEIRRQAAGLHKPTNVAARDFANAWRMRLRQHYQYNYSAHLKQLRAQVQQPVYRSTRSGTQAWDEERVLWDAIELFHAAHPGLKVVTVQQAQAARALLDSPMAEGGRPLRRPADVQRFIRELRGQSRPQPAVPGADTADMRSLLAKVAEAMATPGNQPVSKRYLRQNWNPPADAVSVPSQTAAGPSSAAGLQVWLVEVPEPRLAGIEGVGVGGVEAVGVGAEGVGAGLGGDVVSTVLADVDSGRDRPAGRGFCSPGEFGPHRSVFGFPDGGCGQFGVVRFGHCLGRRSVCGWWSQAWARAG